MRFRIHCSNPKTGQTHEFELDAHDRAEAEQEVLNAGLVVGRIEAADDEPADATAPTRPRGEAALQVAGEERRRVGMAARIIGWGGLGAIVLAVLATVLSGGGEDYTYHEIRASVRFDGGRFTIVNRDEFAWRDVLIDINGGLANRGYTLRADALGGGQEVVAAAIDFVDEQGNHYDPAEEPLRQLRIFCDIGDGKKALHTRRW